MTLARLETAAKYVGAAVTILGAVGGIGGVTFSWAMAERDNDAGEMREDIDALKTALVSLSTSASDELGDMNDRFFDVRLALEALRVQVAFSAATPASPVELEPVRLSRPPRRAPLLSRLRGGSEDAVRPVGEDNGSGPVVELHDSDSAELALDEAMGRLEEP